MATEEKNDYDVTVCDYLGTLFVKFPMFVLVGLVVAPFFFPYLWFMDKLPTSWKNRKLCPFGRVKFTHSTQDYTSYQVPEKK